jgi:hypothetical protein
VVRATPYTTFRRVTSEKHLDAKLRANETYKEYSESVATHLSPGNCELRMSAHSTILITVMKYKLLSSELKIKGEAMLIKRKFD